MFNKKADRVETFGNDGRTVSKLTTKYSAPIIMLGVVASNGEKMPSVWCERGYRLTSAVYKEVLEAKVLPWVKNISKKSDYFFQQD